MCKLHPTNVTWKGIRRNYRGCVWTIIHQCGEQFSGVGMYCQSEMKNHHMWTLLDRIWNTKEVSGHKLLVMEIVLCIIPPCSKKWTGNVHVIAGRHSLYVNFLHLSLLKLHLFCHVKDKYYLLPVCTMIGIYSYSLHSASVKGWHI